MPHSCCTFASVCLYCREQYSEPVCVLDLVKRLERRPRESVLGCAYSNAVRWGCIGSCLLVRQRRSAVGIMPDSSG
jgi:hypothetical protein